MVKVTSEQIPDSQVQLNIEVEPERLQKSLDQAYRRVAQQVNIPGFRRGKAPRSVIDRFVGKDAILHEGVEHLVGEVYQEAIEELGIEPIDEPTLDLEPKIHDLKPEDTLVIKAIVPVQPTVEAGDYQSIRIPTVEVSVSSEEISGIIDQVREQSATWTPLERAVAEGDRITIDISGAVNTHAQLYSPTGEPIVQSGDGSEFLKQEKYEFVVSTETPIFPKGVAEELIGMESGADKRFELSLPADFADPALASKLAIFNVKVHEVKEKSLPAIDDELAKSVGYQTVEEMRLDVERRAQVRAEAKANESYENSVIDRALELSTFEVPPTLVEHEIEHQIEHLRDNLRQQRLELAQYLQFTGQTEPQIRDQMREGAARTVKTTLLLQKIAELENVEVSENELDEQAELVAMMSGAQADKVRQQLKQPERRAVLASRLRRSKALAALITIARGVGEKGDPMSNPSESTQTSSDDEAQGESAQTVSGDTTEVTASAEESAPTGEASEPKSE